MATDREDDLAGDTHSCISERERREIMTEIRLLLDFDVPVSFDGNNVVLYQRRRDVG